MPGDFRNLIIDACHKFRQSVVILFDEYDKPILDNLHNSETAIEQREGLKNLYSVIKDADEYIKFCFLTGVSKFSKVSLFSALNNLIDITLDTKYSDICGYTDKDLTTVFAPELDSIDKEKVRAWYNGYNWRGVSVYNPFDILLYFAKQEFRPYWFESATPTFLVSLMREHQVNSLDLANLYSDHDLLGHFDVDHIGTEALLFQTGYLTIKSESEPVPGAVGYQLSHPNREVETSLNKALLPNMGIDISTATRQRLPVFKALENGDFDALHQQLKSLYASIPHDWYRNNPIKNYEGHYASIIYSHLSALGLDIEVESTSANGQVDMTIILANTAFIFEFKVVEKIATGSALRQIIERNYAEKYRALSEKTFGIGIEFSKESRQIVAFESRLL